jgi:hypothetical protein
MTVKDAFHRSSFVELSVRTKLGTKCFENLMSVLPKTASSKRTFHLSVALFAAMRKWTNSTFRNPSDLGD